MGGEDVAMVNMARFVCGEFLLDGDGKMRSDESVKVSLKVLAVNLLAQLISIHPPIFNSFLFHHPSFTHLSTIHRFEHTMLYAKHPDPNLRGSVCLLVSAYLSASLSPSSTISDLPLSRLGN